MDIENLRTIGIFIAVCVGIAGLLGITLLVLMAVSVRRISIPQDANFFETLQYTPFLVVVGIDLLDLGFDILAAPVVWLILNWMGLKALRGFAAFEALVPFTGIIPTMTIAWFIARLQQAPIEKTI
jgi:hypothetical protein